MAERRNEPRHHAEGPVRLILEEPKILEIAAELLDSSRSGFRASHHYSALHSGQEVRFTSDLSQGRARVMWNRILPDRVETGFLIV